jgi:hypothetical protein
MTDDDPNEAYEVVPIEPGPHGPPEDWWTVKRNGLPVRHFPGKEKAERYATDPEYRASLVAGNSKSCASAVMTVVTMPCAVTPDGGARSADNRRLRPTSR